MTHTERLQAARTRFDQVLATLAAEVEALDSDTATRNPAPESWNAAQIAHHVGQTTDLLSNAMSGAIPDLVKPRREDHVEIYASLDLSGPIQTMPMLVPPEEVERDAGVARLRASAATFYGALESVTEERASSELVELPFGLFTLYEVAEFTGEHVVRHTGQMRRAVAG